MSRDTDSDLSDYQKKSVLLFPAKVIGFLGLLTAAINTVIAFSSDENKASKYRVESTDSGTILVKEHRSSSSLIIISESTKATTRIDANQICTDQFQLVSFVFFPLIRKNHYCQPIKDIDIPMIKEFAEKAGYKGEFSFNYVPTKQHSISINPKP